MSSSPLPPDKPTDMLELTSEPNIGCICIVGIAGLCVLSLLSTWAFRQYKRQRATEPARNAIAESRETLQEQMERTISESERKAEQTRKANWQPLRDQLDALRATHADNVRISGQLNSLLEELLTSDNGRRLASDRFFVGRFLSIRDSQRPSKDEFHQMQHILDGFDKQWREAVEDPSLVIGPDEKLKEAVSSLANYTKQWNNTLSSIMSTLEALILQASSRSPSSKTLKQAIDNFVNKNAQQRTANPAGKRDVVHEPEFPFAQLSDSDLPIAEHGDHHRPGSRPRRPPGQPSDEFAQL